MNSLITILTKSGLLTEDLDYHVVRASMVIIFLFFGYQKWFEYEAQVLIPYISNGPLISWMYPVFGIRGASWFLGVSEWVFGALLFAGFWNKTYRNSWGPRCMRFIHRDRHDYPVHAGWLGSVCRRVSGHGWQRAVPDEGCGAVGCISLFAEAGCRESATFRWAPRTRWVGAGWSPIRSRSCMNRSTRSTAGEGLHMIAVSVSLMTVRVAQGGSACFNQNGLKPWSLAVERVASY
jgi:Protein of unknown function, DUF417